MNRVPGEVIGPAIQKIVAKRLGRAGSGLAVISVLGLVELAVGPQGVWTNLITILAPLACAGSLLVIGTRAVRRAFGNPPPRWSPLISVLGLIPLVFGFWLLTFRGLRAFALGGAPSMAWFAWGAWTVLGYRVLIDSTRLSEAGLLAQTMIVPAAEETS